jgi:tRNA 2-thiocytidine biosynthesis protein TtcA
MLRDWEKKHPGRTDTIFGALTNVAPSHLLDRTLYDFTRVMATDEPDVHPIHLAPRASRLAP